MVKYWKDLARMPRGIWIVAITALVNRAGSMVMPFLTLYLTRQLGFSVSQAGFLFFLYGLGAIAAGPLAGRLSDRLGPAAVMKASLFLSGAVFLVYPYARSIASVMTATLALAVTSEAFRPASMAVVGALVRPQDRKSAFALYRLAINLGMSVGPAAGGILAALSFRYLFLADGATSLLAGAVLVASVLRVGGEGSQSRAPAPWRAHADRRFLFFLAAIFPVLLVFFQHVSSMPLFLVRELGISMAAFGFLFSINTVLIVFLEIPLIGRTAHWPHRRTLMLGALLSGAGFGAMALASGIVSVAATVVIWTFGEMLFFPGSAACSTELAPADRQGEYGGLYLATFSLAFAVGPWAGTAVLGRFGGRVLWGTTFLLGLVSAAMLSRLKEPERALMASAVPGPTAAATPVI
jgi:predicted MFS family arabinose efflux permease